MSKTKKLDLDSLEAETLQRLLRNTLWYDGFVNAGRRDVDRILGPASWKVLWNILHRL